MLDEKIAFLLVMGTIVLSTILLMFTLHFAEILNDYKTYKKMADVQITFKQLMTFYNLDPKKWSFSIWAFCAVYKKTKKNSKTSCTYYEEIKCVMSTFPDYLKYLKWVKRYKKQKAERKQMKKQEEFLKSISDDIKTQEALAQKEIDDAMARMEKIRKSLQKVNNDLTEVKVD